MRARRAGVREGPGSVRAPGPFALSCRRGSGRGAGVFVRVAGERGVVDLLDRAVAVADADLRLVRAVEVDVEDDARATVDELDLVARGVRHDDAAEDAGDLGVEGGAG